MLSQIIFSSIYFILTIFQLLLAGYILLSNPKGAANRVVAAFLVLLSLNSFSTVILQQVFTFNEAAFWLAARVATTYMIPPTIYLVSVILLRPGWLRHRWLYYPAIFLIWLPVLSVVLDTVGVSRILFANNLFYTPPDPTSYTGSSLATPFMTGGILRPFFFATQIGFPLLTLICPSLVVALRDRKSTPESSRLAWAYFGATLIASIIWGGLVSVLDPQTMTIITSLAFVLAFLYAGLGRVEATLSLRRLQLSLGNWPVFAKLLLVILGVTVPTVATVGLSTLSLLRTNAIQQTGANLQSLASFEAQNIGNELRIQVLNLQRLAQDSSVTSAIESQNERYAGLDENEIYNTYLASELEWHTTGTTAAFVNHPAALGDLEKFIDTFPDHKQVIVTDQEGALIAGTDSPEHYNWSQAIWWRSAFSKGEGDVYISTPLFDRQSESYYINISVPIRSEQTGEIIGIIFSRYDFSAINQSLAQVGDTEPQRSAIFNTLGLLIPNQLNTPPENKHLDWVSFLQQRDTSWQLVSFNGEDSVFGWSIIKDNFPADSTLGNVEWRVAVLQSTKDTLASILFIRNIALFTLFASIGVSIALAIVLARVITQPLNDLARTANLVREGNLNVETEVAGGDEFGTLALTFNSMTAQLREMVSGLETQVSNRTKALEKRAIQLQAAAEVGSAVRSIRDLDELLTKVTHLISERFGFYHTGIFLLDENHAYAILRAANSPGGQRMLARGHKLRVGEVGIVGYVTGKGEPRIALDVGHDAVYFDNPDMPETRSEMALPLVSGDEILGALDVQSTEEAAFAPEDISILQVLADQLAVAIENAKLFARSQASLTETQTALEAARRAYRDVSQREWRDFLEDRQEIGYVAGEKGIHEASQQHFTPEMAEASIKGRTTQGDPTTVAVPIKIQDKVAGVMRLRKAAAHAWTKNEISLVENLTEQISVALESARLYQETQESLDEAERQRRINETLAKAASKLAQARTENEAHQILTSEVNAVVLPDQINLYEWLPDQAAFRVDQRLTPGDAEDDYQIGDLVSQEDRPDLWEVFQSAQPVLDAERAGDGYVHEHYCLPWFAADQVSGVIELFHTAKSLHIREEDQITIRGIIQQAAVAIQSARNFDQTQEALARTAALFQVSQSTTMIGGLTELLEAFVDTVSETLPADRVVLNTLDLDKKQVTGFVQSGFPTGGAVEPAFEDFQKGLYSQVLRERKPVLSTVDLPAGTPGNGGTTHGLGGGRTMVVPLIYRDRVLGTLKAENDLDNDEFNEQDVDLLMAMANQMATAMENTRLFEQQQRRALQLQTAAEISQAASSILDLNELLPQAVELIRERFSLYYVGLFLVEDTEEWAVLRAGTGHAGRIQVENKHKLKIGGDSMIGQALSSGQARIAMDVGGEAIHFQNPYLPDTRSEMALPLYSRGRGIGALTVQSTRPAAFSQEDITTLQTMADQLANAIENARLFEQTEARADELAVLNEMGRLLTSMQDIDGIFENIHKFTDRLMESSSFLAALYDDEHNLISFPLVIEEGERLSISPRQGANGLMDYVIRNKTPLLISDNLPERTRELGVEYRMVGEPALSWLGVPILIGQQVIGAISVQTIYTPRLYTQRHLDLLISISNQAANAIQNARLFQQTQQRSEELVLINRVVTQVAAAFDLREGLQIVSDELGKAIGAGRVGVALMNETQSELTVVADYRADPDNPTAVGINIPVAGNPSTQEVLRTKKSLVIEDAQNNPIAAPMNEVFRERGIETVIVMPLIARNEIMGTIGLDILEGGESFTPDQLRLAETIVFQASTAIYNSRLYTQTQDALSETAALYQASAELNAVENFDDILSTLRKFTVLGHDQAGSVFLNLFDTPWQGDSPPEWLIPIAHWSRPPFRPRLTSRFPLTDQPGARKFFDRDAPTLFENLDGETEAANQNTWMDLPAQSAIFTPLLVGGQWIGHIIGLYDEKTDFPEAEIRRLRVLSQ